jgi:hypothetical protein
MTDRTRTSESGIALVFAIVMMVLILGFLAVFTLASTNSRDERITERGRMQSEVWADAAADAIAARLESGELGYHVTNVIAGGKRGRLLHRPPVAPFAGTSVSYGAGSCAPAYPISSGAGGKGFYCLRAPVAGQPQGTGFLNLEPSDPEHGTVTFVVRTWGSQGKSRPLDVELTFGRESLSRYAVLSDAPITLDKSVGAGSLTLPAGARLHSNNTSNSAYGVYMRGAVNHAAASRITTTRASSGSALEHRRAPTATSATSRARRSASTRRTRCSTASAKPTRPARVHRTTWHAMTPGSGSAGFPPRGCSRRRLPDTCRCSR